jgi:hypothetical protein
MPLAAGAGRFASTLACVLVMVLAVGVLPTAGPAAVPAVPAAAPVVVLPPFPISARIAAARSRMSLVMAASWAGVIFLGDGVTSVKQK